MRHIKRIIFILIVVLAIFYTGVKDSLSPLQREQINNPIFTIGDINYKRALKEGKNIVKFGPMFWGIYPGGIVFSTPQKAKNYIQNNSKLLSKFSSGWAIYKLSGDMDFDATLVNNNQYLNKSLLVVEAVKID